MNFMTFASSNWTKSPVRYSQYRDQIQKYGFFDKFLIWNEHDLGKEYENRFSRYYSDHGFAYFSWKPYSLRLALEQIQDGDFLMYLDSGCVLPIDRFESFITDTEKATDRMKEKSIDMCLTTYIDRNPNIVIPNICIVKKQILEKFGLTDNQKFLFQYPHFQAGLCILRKTQNMIDFLNRWYDFFDKNYESCIRGGYTDKTDQDPRYFLHNGSDQAVLQCMLFTEKPKLMIANYFYNYGVIAHQMG